MKLLLKDVIKADSKCKDLLCSYQLKTILFRISEKVQPSVWTPGNLIPCFTRCFRRLIYCLQYQVCPYYFIPENNLFQNKIEGHDRFSLIDTLLLLFCHEWHDILFSKQRSYFADVSCDVKNTRSLLYYEDINTFLESKILSRVSSDTEYTNFI